MAIDPKSLSVDYKDLLKNTGVKKQDVKGQRPNEEYKKRLASLSPTDIARGLKPEYLSKGNMSDAISGDKSKSQAGGGGLDGDDGPGGGRRGGRGRRGGDDDREGPQAKPQVALPSDAFRVQPPANPSFQPGSAYPPKTGGGGGAGVTPQGQAMLDTIATREAEPAYNKKTGERAGWDVGVGSTKLDMSNPQLNPEGARYSGIDIGGIEKHAHHQYPNWRGFQGGAGTSYAFGRYQETTATYYENVKRSQKLHPGVKVDGWSPEAQNVRNWDKAQEVYKRSYSKLGIPGLTGDLQKDLETHKDNPGMVGKMSRALSGEWTSAPGGSEGAKQTGGKESYYEQTYKEKLEVAQQEEAARIKDGTAVAQPGDVKDIPVTKTEPGQVSADLFSPELMYKSGDTQTAAPSPDDSVIETQKDVAGTRTLGIKPELKSALSYAADQTGIKFEVSSGGQAHGKETGSHRHNVDIKGTIGAADGRMFVLDEQGKKRYLNVNNPADREKIEKFTKSFSEVAPSAGVGADYMSKAGSKARGELFHFGGGNREGDKAVAYEGPAWFRKAHGEGRKGYDSDDTRKKYEAWKIEKERLIEEAKKKNQKVDESVVARNEEEAKKKAAAKAETAKPAEPSAPPTAKPTEPAKFGEPPKSAELKPNEPAKPAEPAPPTAKPAEPAPPTAKPTEPAPESKKADNAPPSEGPIVLAQGGDVPIDSDQVTAVPVPEDRKSGGRENIGIMENDQMVAKVNSKEQLKYDAGAKKIDVTPEHKVRPEQLEKHEKSKDDDRRDIQETHRQQTQNALGNNPAYSANRDFINPVVPTDHVLNTSQHRHFERAQFFAGSRHYNHGATNERGGV